MCVCVCVDIAHMNWIKMHDDTNIDNIAITKLTLTNNAMQCLVNWSSLLKSHRCAIYGT